VAFFLTWALFAPCGCGKSGESLTIATAWPASARARITEEFAAWYLRTEAGLRAGVAPRLRWLVLAASDDLARVVRRRAAPDVLLGGPATLYRRLDDAGVLAPAVSGAPAWHLSRRAKMGLAINVRSAGLGPASGAKLGIDPHAPGAPERARLITFDDPRHDPVALLWARNELATAGSWPEGYARLVRFAGGSRRPGRQAGSAQAAVESSEADLTPAAAQPEGLPPGMAFVAESEGEDWLEGVAAVRGGHHPALAEAFIRFVAETQGGMLAADDAPTPPAHDALLGDLLGSTLVDAQDELWAAWAALETAGRPARAEGWMTEPPPWPPASVERILARDESPMSLLETLAAQIAPDADTRGWLLRSWLAPRRLIEGRVLEELSEAVDGRLIREPRFRAWLRGEWTAWARQRYRRVARLSQGPIP
jgi:hypothetical protein